MLLLCNKKTHERKYSKKNKIIKLKICTIFLTYLSEVHGMTDEQPQQEEQNVQEKSVYPVAAHYLAVESPQQRHLKKRLDVIAWVHRWGYSSADLIRQVAGMKSGGFATSLVKKGWLVKTKTESGMPRFIYTLSKTGLQEAERRADQLFRYPELDPYRVNQLQIRHYLLAQDMTLFAFETRFIADYKTERMFDEAGDIAGQKRPDIVWERPDGKLAAIEIELSAKWDRRLDEFVRGLLRSLNPYGRFPPKYVECLIVTDSPAIKRRYEAAMSLGAPLKTWEKKSSSQWVVTHRSVVPDWLLDHVRVYLVKG